MVPQYTEDEDSAIMFDMLYIPIKDSLIDAFIEELDKLLDKYAIDEDDVAYNFDVEG